MKNDSFRVAENGLTPTAWEYHMGYGYDHSIFNINVHLPSLKDFTLNIE